MRLLICTQMVDKNDPILGFFHGWLEELSRHFSEIQVICLKEGVHALPKNVHVYSLGKENGESTVKYVTRFYRYLYRLQHSYDRVFVHMNPHYVVLGGMWWSLTKTRVFFWRNHAQMNFMTRIGAFFARQVFYTSPFACTSRYVHAVQMPVGIDLSRFIPHRTEHKGKTKVLFLGRLSPVKRAEIFIDAGRVLGDAYELHVYGDDPTSEKKYIKALKERAGENIFFHSAVKNEETPQIYRTHDIYVNLTPEGSMDKTVLEAVACGTAVIVTNTSFSNILPEYSVLADVTPERLAKKILDSGTIPLEKKDEYREGARRIVEREHSLEKLGILLHKYITEKYD